MNPNQELLSAAALTAFRLNGQFLHLAERLARPVGLTAAWWQVLGAVQPGPLTVAGIAREMGMARQSVQRIADLVVDRGMARYVDNPAHRRAKLLEVTQAGLAAVSRIGPAHAEAASGLVEVLGEDRMREIVDAMRDLSAALDKIS